MNPTRQITEGGVKGMVLLLALALASCDRRQRRIHRPRALRRPSRRSWLPTGSCH